jgi:hypothetical protein
MILKVCHISFSIPPMQLPLYLLDQSAQSARLQQDSDAIHDPNEVLRKDLNELRKAVEADRSSGKGKESGTHGSEDASTWIKQCVVYCLVELTM